MNYIVYIIFFLFSMLSCSQKNAVMDMAHFSKYMNNEDHGLLKRKYVNHLELKMTYLSPSYLTSIEGRRTPFSSLEQKDSVLKAFSNVLTFELAINPDERDSVSVIEDVMFYNLKSKEDYNRRMLYMNFDIKNDLHLKLNSKTEYQPVLVNMENHYGLGKGRKVIMVFAPITNINEFKKTENIELIWDDAVFETGRHYFEFKTEDIFNTPTLNE